MKSYTIPVFFLEKALFSAFTSKSIVLAFIGSLRLRGRRLVVEDMGRRMAFICVCGYRVDGIEAGRYVRGEAVI